MLEVDMKVMIVKSKEQEEHTTHLKAIYKETRKHMMQVNPHRERYIHKVREIQSNVQYGSSQVEENHVETKCHINSFI